MRCQLNDDDYVIKTTWSPFQKGKKKKNPHSTCNLLLANIGQIWKNLCASLSFLNSLQIFIFFLYLITNVAIFFIWMQKSNEINVSISYYVVGNLLHKYSIEKYSLGWKPNLQLKICWIPGLALFRTLMLRSVSRLMIWSAVRGLSTKVVDIFLYIIKTDHCVLFFFFF